ncbi:MAG: hypothetical protein ACLFXM_02790, partial [Acidimicrobiia bacterium]
MLAGQSSACRRNNATEAALRAALATDIGDAAHVVVAQRVSTIRTADRIVVLSVRTIDAVGDRDHSWRPVRPSGLPVVGRPAMPLGRAP